MKRFNGWTSVGLLGVALATACAAADEGGDAEDVVDLAPSSEALSGRVIVAFRDDAGSATPEGLRRRALTRRAHIEGLGGRLVKELGALDAVAAELTAGQFEALRNDPRVAFVEADPIRQPIHPVSARAVSFTGERVPYGIQMVQADQVSDARIGNRTVCIVDTGYDVAHPDLRAAGGGTLTGQDNNGSGADTGEWSHDGHGHGTHVAGTISALRGNGIGVVGVAGNNAIGLHIVKVFSDAGTWAYGSDLIAATEQCVAAGAHVISMSLGGPSRSAAEEAAFQRATQRGVLVIAAAGNDGNTAVSYPAGYGAVASVAALDENRGLATFSQRNDDVEFAAPGVDVLSTLPDNRYEAWSGTSMATPHVSGVAALVWSHFPDCPPGAIRQALAVSAEDLGSAGRDPGFGHGLVRARAAYDYLATNGCPSLPGTRIPFRLQTGTGLHQTDDAFEFESLANGDLVALKKRGAGRTEVHVLSAASNYQRFALQTGTALGETDGTFQLLVAANGDLFAVKKRGTGTGRTELHVLSAASNYQQFTLHTGTALGETDDAFEFALAQNRDLVAIKKRGTGSRTTEVHVLSAASNYQQFTLQTASALHETDDAFQFDLLPNRDLLAVKKRGTGTRSTEIHVLSARDGYRSFARQQGTALHETDASFEFEALANGDVAAIKKSGTGTQTTELHVLDL